MDKLCTKSLDKIHQLINEKKSTRKFYNDEKQRLEMEFAKVRLSNVLLLRCSVSHSSYVMEWLAITPHVLSVEY